MCVCGKHYNCTALGLSIMMLSHNLWLLESIMHSYFDIDNFE